MIGSILDKTKSYLKENGVDVDAEQDEKLETTLTLPVIQAEVKQMMRDYLQSYREDATSETRNENVQSCQYLYEDSATRGRTPVSRGSHVRGQIQDFDHLNKNNLQKEMDQT